MKVNILTDENNIIIACIRSPISDKMPIIEIDKDEEILIGYDMLLDGMLIKNTEAFEETKISAQKLTRINELKKLLANSDYNVIKLYEGAMTEKEFEPIKIQRQAWRAEINKLEEEIK